MTSSVPAPTRALRVLYLSWRDDDNPESGGAETFLERTSRVLTELGHEVTIFTARFPGSAARTWHGDVRVIRRGNRYTCYLAGLAHVAAHRDEFDVIIDVQNGVPFFSVLAAKAPVVNLVHHVHEDQWDTFFPKPVSSFGWWLERSLAPWAYRRADYLTVSQATSADLQRLGIEAHRIEVNHSGNDVPADLAAYDAVPRTTHPSLAVVGRLVPHKDVELAVDLVATLADSHPDLVLDVVGAGFWHDAIVAHARSRGVAERVVMHGFVSDADKHRILAGAWLHVMPSRKEGWGLTIVEAGLHGTPTIAFAYAGGPSESIVHGRTGWLARDPDELAAVVARLLDDPDERARMGSQARAHALSFDWASTGLRLAAMLERVTGRRRADGDTTRR